MKDTGAIIANDHGSHRRPTRQSGAVRNGSKIEDEMLRLFAGVTKFATFCSLTQPGRDGNGDGVGVEAEEEGAG